MVFGQELGRIMEPDDEKLKKFARKSEIESRIDSKEISKEIGLETLTNFEAFQQGKFPENLVEEFRTPDSLPSDVLVGEIEAKHKEILEGRPLPDLLENSELVGNLEDLKPPAMGKLYEEKKNHRISSKDERSTKE